MITIWHNPRCSKSRQTLALIEASGHPVTIRKYLEVPPSPEELRALLTLLGQDVHAIIRRNETTFRALDLKTASDVDLLQALADHPILIERPIVMTATCAIIGRPPENVKGLL